MNGADYRDPRNGETVDRALATIERDASVVLADLARLSHELAPDIEMTPDQAGRFADALGAIGIAGNAILVRDVRLTFRRESR